MNILEIKIVLLLSDKTVLQQLLVSVTSGAAGLLLRSLTKAFNLSN